MIVTQHAHIYSFHTSKFNFGETFFLIFLSIQPLVGAIVHPISLEESEQFLVGRHRGHNALSLGVMEQHKP
jgi:hypothetical protein